MKLLILSKSRPVQVMNPDPYRGIWGGYRDSPVQSLRAKESDLLEGGTLCSSTPKYVKELQDTLDYCVHQGKPAAFFAESIQVFEICAINSKINGTPKGVYMPISYGYVIMGK